MRNVPNSRTNLDKAILRFAGEIRRANELRTLMANAIVAQMIGEGARSCRSTTHLGQR